MQWKCCASFLPSFYFPFYESLSHHFSSTQSHFSSRSTHFNTSIKNSHSHTSNFRTEVVSVRENSTEVVTRHHCWNFLSAKPTPKVGRIHFEFASLCLKALTWNFHEVVAQNLLKFNSERCTCYGYKVHSDWEQEHRQFQEKTLKTCMCIYLYSWSCKVRWGSWCDSKTSHWTSL